MPREREPGSAVHLERSLQRFRFLTASYIFCYEPSLEWLSHPSSPFWQYLDEGLASVLQRSFSHSRTPKKQFNKNILVDFHGLITQGSGWKSTNAVDEEWKNGSSSSSPTVPPHGEDRGTCALFQAQDTIKARSVGSSSQSLEWWFLTEEAYCIFLSCFKGVGCKE